MQYRFTHITGTKANQVDTVESAPILLGRDASCQIRFDKDKDLAVSSKHCQIDEVEDGRWQLANLSRNGTFLNGKLVEAAAPLQNHATIELGQGGPRVRFDVDQNVSGMSMADLKRKTQKLLREVGEGPTPTTEERPIFKLEDLETKKSSGIDAQTVKLVLVVVLSLVLLTGAVFVFFKFWT